jgi:hypothetical protein
MEQIGILYMIPLLIGYAGTEKHLLSIVSDIDRKRFVPHVCYFRGSNKVVSAFQEGNVFCKELAMKRIYETDVCFLWVDGFLQNGLSIS